MGDVDVSLVNVAIPAFRFKENSLVGGENS